MRQSHYNLILTVLAAIALIVPFTGKVHDGRSARNGWLKGFTKRGWYLVVAVLASVLVTYFKDKSAEEEDKLKEISISKQKRNDDSIATIELNESNAKIVSAFTTSLALYGLKYDSTQKVIAKLVRDSSKKEFKLVKNQPNISLSNISLQYHNKDSCRLRITVFCKYAPSEHVDMELHLAIESKQAIQLVNLQQKFKMKNISIGADKQISSDLKLGPLPPNSTFMHFLFEGKYEDDSGYKHVFRELSTLELANNGFGVLFDPEYSRVLTFFNESLRK